MRSQATATRVGQLRDQRVEPIAPARRDDDARPRGREHAGEPVAEPAARAGDECDASVEPERLQGVDCHWRRSVGTTARLVLGSTARQTARQNHIDYQPTGETMGSEVRDFRVEVAPSVIDDLRDRLGRTRWTDQIPGSGWGYGTDLAYLRDLCETWRTSFDWPAQEARLQSLAARHHRDRRPVGALHPRAFARARRLAAHHHARLAGIGVEFLDVIDPLCNPRAHGGDPADAFHVVCPSMPGYGLSGPTGDRGWDVRRIAEAWIVLMARLGYERYGAQGGDWGSMVSSQVGSLDPDHVAGVHLNMVIGAPPPTRSSSATMSRPTSRAWASS